MASSHSGTRAEAANLAFRLVDWPDSRAVLLPVHAHDEFDVGRMEVQNLLSIRDKTISMHHVRLRCVMFDEHEPDVSPMIYAQTLSPNGVLLHTSSLVGYTCRELKNDRNEALLNQGDVVQLSATVSFRLDVHRRTTKDATARHDIARETQIHSPDDKYIITPRIIGSGAYAKVVVAVKQPQDIQVACKIIPLPSEPIGRAGLAGAIANSRNEKCADMRRRRAAVFREIDVLSQIHHPNIVRLEKVFQTPDTLYVFQELATAGDLMSYLQMKDGVDEAEAVTITYQLAQAIHFLHGANVVHRDIKPENILMTSWRVGTRVILTDFGQSRLMEAPDLTAHKASIFRMESLVGTDGWIAPEVQKRRLPNSKVRNGYSKAVDIWALGSVTFALVTNEIASTYLCFGRMDSCSTVHGKTFPEVDRFKVLNEDENWRPLSRNAKSFIRRCLAVVEEQRLTAEEAVIHPWFTNAHYAAELHATYTRAISDWKPRADDEAVQCIENLQHSSTKTRSIDDTIDEPFSRNVSTYFPMRASPFMPSPSCRGHTPSLSIANGDPEPALA